MWPRAGSRDADPYTRAVNARTGGIPLGVGEGLVLRAAADDAGRALDARCAYRIGTTAPQARYWTLALYDETGRPVETPLGRASFIVGRDPPRCEGQLHARALAGGAERQLADDAGCRRREPRHAALRQPGLVRRGGARRPQSALDRAAGVQLVTLQSQFLLATICAFVLAGIVHLATVLAIPHLAEKDAFSRLRATLSTDRSEIVAAPGDQGTWLPYPDPDVALSTCAYTLDEGPVRVSARTGALFQSLSLHARTGGVFFAITDRAAIRGALDLVVMTRRQLDEALASEDPDEPSRDVRIVSPAREGLVVVRVLAVFPSQRERGDGGGEGRLLHDRPGIVSSLRRSPAAWCARRAPARQAPPAPRRSRPPTGRRAACRSRRDAPRASRAPARPRCPRPAAPR